MEVFMNQLRKLGFISSSLIILSFFCIGFTNCEKKWQGPALVISGVSHPRIGIDGKGNALVISNDSSTIFSISSSLSKGWGNKSIVMDGLLNYAKFPEVAVNSKGDAVACWSVMTDIGYNSWYRVYGSVYSPASGWSNPQLLSTTASDKEHAEYAKPAIDADGNAIVVWEEIRWAYQDNKSRLSAVRYDSIKGWGQEEHVTPDYMGTNSAYPFDLAINDNGAVYVIWSYISLYVKAYHPDKGWSEIQQVSPIWSQYLKVAVKNDDTAIAMWEQDNHLYSSMNNSEGIWQTPVCHEDTNWVSDISVFFDKAGNAISIWTSRDQAKNSNDVWSKRFQPGKGWDTPVIIGSKSGDEVSPVLSVNKSGEAFAAWSCNLNNSWVFRIFSNHYTTAKGWGTATMIDTDHTNANSVEPQISIDSNGNAVVIWKVSGNAPSELWSNIWK